MQRIYLPNTELHNILEISQRELYHQITRVMRARVGQEFVFFDGENLCDHFYRITDINKNICRFEKQKTEEKISEPSCEMTLYQASPNKLSKFETIVQKCCEIGYKKIIFFESERSQKLIISENKKERLTKIAIEAIEQCGGNIIPDIEYRYMLGPIQGESIICHTQGSESVSLTDIIVGKQLNILVGPEGGFSLQEVEEISAQKIYFGERILRCETVGEVVGFYLSQKK